MAKLHFLLLVFHQLCQRKYCAALYMMILEYHEKYGRRCNFSRRDRELYYLLSPGETRSRFSFYHSHVSRRYRDYILLFSCFETRTRNTDWMSQGRARKISVNSHEILREREFSVISALKLWHYIQCFICETQPPASIGWVALSSLVRCPSVPPGDMVSYINYMMFQTTQTIYFMRGHDPGNVSVSSYDHMMIIIWSYDDHNMIIWWS